MQDITCSSVKNLRSFFWYGIKGLSAALKAAVMLHTLLVCNSYSPTEINETVQGYAKELVRMYKSCDDKYKSVFKVSKRSKLPLDLQQKCNFRKLSEAL